MHNNINSGLIKFLENQFETLQLIVKQNYFVYKLFRLEHLQYQRLFTHFLSNIIKYIISHKYLEKKQKKADDISYYLLKKDLVVFPVS